MAWEEVTGRDSSFLIDIFLFTNVTTCFFFTDITRILGLKKVIMSAATLMTVGCFLRSGVPLVGNLPVYQVQVLGTMLVGAAQPFFQCSPPQLSATWFGNKERALATAVAINFNQVGIATAFLVGGAMVATVGRDSVAGLSQDFNQYFGVISLLSLAVTAATLLLFQERPPSPPSASAAEHFQRDDTEHSRPLDLKHFLTYPKTAVDLLTTKGFGMPLAAFVASIGVTNVVSAFTKETLNRGGLVDDRLIDFAGAGFQMAIVLGGIFVGGYVDRTKKFKQVTLACLSMTLGLLILLGIGFGYDIDLPHWLVLTALLGLGATAGPVQPINAELAVEVTYPSDENAVEATQQLAGNLFSALLVPVCHLASKFDFEIWSIGPDEDMRGDTVVLILLVVSTIIYYRHFDAPLKRNMLDQRPSDVDDEFEMAVLSPLIIENIETVEEGDTVDNIKTKM
eukprot:CAMPEP_0196591080 /NCGR_PEP_ID=MMETSP1081-20130531/68457_1 /TAXON_ID=36882 /ORGANISM="Pyramimonas amylifera, Strain CCMP720" /LENGTH=452 /DNA_ID=CAMNT_0041914341 /DNA_START=278 /DNA_END=1636 /DNA_ORIENTATION=+